MPERRQATEDSGLFLALQPVAVCPVTLSDVPDIGKLTGACNFAIILYETMPSLSRYLEEHNVGITARQLIESASVVPDAKNGPILASKDCRGTAWRAEDVTQRADYRSRKILRKLRYMRRTARRVPLLSGWWNDARFFWHTRNKAPWIAALIVGVIITTFSALAYWLESNTSEKRELTCLALNVYYESRGEPLAGKFAVAEVTMNRVASRRYPGTVCEVVYEKRWDRLRKRYVGAFSWTEFDIIPHPEGEQWQQAREVAEAVYFGRQPPQLNGALHYHATYIRPSWTRGRQPVARIGGHVFYK